MSSFRTFLECFLVAKWKENEFQEKEKNLVVTIGGKRHTLVKRDGNINTGKDMSSLNINNDNTREAD